MIIKNTSSRFGIIAILLHWVMAFLLIGLVGLGFYMNAIPVSLEKLRLYGWHKEFGILALMLVIVRFTWRLNNITPSLSQLVKPERIAARIAHCVLFFHVFYADYGYFSDFCCRTPCLVFRLVYHSCTGAS